MDLTFAWTAYATTTGLIVAVVALLATALFQHGGKLDRIDERLAGVDAGVRVLGERMQAMDERLAGRADGIDERLGSLSVQMRLHKTELLERLDVLAERITRLEQGS